MFLCRNIKISSTQFILNQVCTPVVYKMLAFVRINSHFKFIHKFECLHQLHGHLYLFRQEQGVRTDFWELINIKYVGIK